MSDVQKRNWKGHPQYLCSRCGQLFAIIEAKITLETLKDFTAFVAMESKDGVFRHIMHGCSEGGVGIAALVGACSLETGERLAKAFAKQALGENVEAADSSPKSN